MSEKRVLKIFGTVFKPYLTQKSLFAPEDFRGEKGSIDLSFLFQAFWDRIEPPLFAALEHLEERIEALEKGAGLNDSELEDIQL